MFKWYGTYLYRKPFLNTGIYRIGRGEGLNLELPKFNLKFKTNSFTYSLTKLWNSSPYQVRLSSDANDLRRKLHDCSFFRTCLMVRTSEVNCTIAVF